MGQMQLPLSRPDITEVERELVDQVLQSGRLSMGPMQELFESQVAREAGCTNAVAVSSGTAGLHLLLRALGIGPGDEVVTTPFSFVASANAILYVGARPVFVDIEPKSLNMDPGLVENAVTDKTKAILAVEAFGNPVHMDVYAAIAARNEIPLIEDCCEALGTRLGVRRCGSFGRAGVFGFYPNKQITTGEGGMIVTDDDRLAKRCRSLRNQGRAEQEMELRESSSVPWLHHERLGYNYRLSEIAAAMGVGQMQRLTRMMEKRQTVAGMYLERLAGHPKLVVPTIEESVDMSWFVFVVRLVTDFSRQERDRVLQGMRNHDIGCADYFPCIHLMPFYREMFGYGEGSFPIAESVSGRTIALPFFNDLAEDDVDIICQTLDLMLTREGFSR